MRAWVPYVNVMLFEGKVPYDNLASNAKNIKDYYPTKKYIKLFDKAVHKAEETYLCPWTLTPANSSGNSCTTTPKNFNCEE